MKKIVKIYYTLPELKERFPDTYKKVVEKLSNDESEFWRPLGDFYFEPKQDDTRDALRIAIENKAPRVYATYDDYKQAGCPEDAYSPGHSFFRFTDYQVVYDVDDRRHRAACPDLRPANDYVFMALLNIPPRLWDWINVKVEFSEYYNANFLTFSLKSTGEEIYADGEPITDRKIERLTKIFETAESIFEDLLLTANQRISEDYYYAISEEGIVELAEHNDLYFDEYGEFLRQGV